VYYGKCSPVYVCICVYVYVCVLFEWKITDPDTIWGMIHSRGSPAFGRSCIFSMEPYLMNVLEQVDYVLFVAWVYSRFGRLKNQSKPNRNILKYLTNLTKIKKQGATCFGVSLALSFSLALTYLSLSVFVTLSLGVELLPDKFFHHPRLLLSLLWPACRKSHVFVLLFIFHITVAVYKWCCCCYSCCFALLFIWHLFVFRINLMFGKQHLNLISQHKVDIRYVNCVSNKHSNTWGIHIKTCIHHNICRHVYRVLFRLRCAVSLSLPWPGKLRRSRCSLSLSLLLASILCVLCATGASAVFVFILNTHIYF